MFFAIVVLGNARPRPSLGCHRAAIPIRGTDEGPGTDQDRSTKHQGLTATPNCKLLEVLRPRDKGPVLRVLGDSSHDILIVLPTVPPATAPDVAYAKPHLIVNSADE